MGFPGGNYSAFGLSGRPHESIHITPACHARTNARLSEKRCGMLLLSISGFEICSIDWVDYSMNKVGCQVFFAFLPHDFCSGECWSLFKGFIDFHQLKDSFFDVLV